MVSVASAKYQSKLNRVRQESAAWEMRRPSMSPEVWPAKRVSNRSQTRDIGCQSDYGMMATLTATFTCIGATTVQRVRT